MARINIEVREETREAIDKIVAQRSKEQKRKVSLKEVLLDGLGLKDK